MHPMRQGPTWALHERHVDPREGSFRNRIAVKRAAAVERRKKKEQERRLIQKQLEEEAARKVLEQGKREQDMKTFLRWMTEVHLKGHPFWREKKLCFGFARDGACKCQGMCPHKKMGFLSTVPFAKNCAFPCTVT